MGCREKGDAKGRTVRKRAYSTICNSTWSKGYCDAFHNDPTLHCPKCNLTKTQHDARVSLPKGDPDRCKKRYWTRIPKGANLWECLKCNYWACSACYTNYGPLWTCSGCKLPNDTADGDFCTDCGTLDPRIPKVAVESARAESSKPKL